MFFEFLGNTCFVNCVCKFISQSGMQLWKYVTVSVTRRVSHRGCVNDEVFPLNRARAKRVLVLQLR